MVHFYSADGKPIKRVGLVGFGKSNRAVYRYLKERFPKLSFVLRSLIMPSLDGELFDAVFTGERELDGINEDILFLSPSVRRDKPELLRAQASGVILSSDTELFFEMTRGDVFAVTGSAGKSTVTYLTSELLMGSYAHSLPCGNYGEPTTAHIGDGESTAYCTELSSFQLMYMQPKSLRSVITNISENHLDWHKSFGEYISAKENILKGSAERIFSADCEVSRAVMQRYPRFALFSLTMSERELMSFGASEIIYLKDNKIYASGKPMLDIRQIRLRGEHNILNFMAAIAMSLGYADGARISALAESFGGLAHRCELVCERGGVRYIDSSIDSTPDRTVKTLSAVGGEVILLLGGRSKGLDYAPLSAVITEKQVKCAVLCGDNREEIRSALLSGGYPPRRLRMHDAFEDAVLDAISIAKPGDAVLLSPASTSFDRFKSFEERGDCFKKTVKENI